MADPSRRAVSLFWSLHFGGWLAFGVVMTLSRVGQFPIAYMAASKGALAIFGFFTSLLLREVYRRALPDGASLPRLLLVTVGASYAGALLWTACHRLVDQRLSATVLGVHSEITGVADLFSGSVYHGFALLAWSVLYVAVRRHLAFEAERARHLRAEALAQRARLQALRYQLQPHFLFNALNALSTLIVEQRSAEASRMLTRIADFLRLTLSGSLADEVTLEEELEFARQYLEIEQVRFADRLAVRFDVPANVRSARVPNLLLQPLLENAIRHGAPSRDGGGVVLIEARREGEKLLVTLSDRPLAAGAAPQSAPGAQPENRDMEGVGLANTRERLSELYGSDYRLELRRFDEICGARVDIVIPYAEGSVS